MYGTTRLITHWRKGQDYFVIRLYRDLVGDWIVSQCWGNCAQGTSAAAETIVTSYEAGRALLKELNRQQKANGYRPAGREETQLGFDFS